MKSEEKNLVENEKEVPDEIEALDAGAGTMQIIEALLKRPLSIPERLRLGSSNAISVKSFICFCISMIAYGLIVGSFSGDIQWAAAPLKILVGLILTMLICFPSLYIFSCLGGAEISPKETFLTLIFGMTLSSVMLIGFAPVSWVFSQSTNSVALMGTFHILFWLVCAFFGIRLIDSALSRFKMKNPAYLKIWTFIFIVTSLQMMTTLRPIIGKSDDLLPKEKKFFLENWIDNMDKGDRREADVRVRD